MPAKTIIGVSILSGNDVLIYSDGSMDLLKDVYGVNGGYFIRVPVDIERALKPEDASNPDNSDLPGYQEAALTSLTAVPATPVGGQSTGSATAS